MPHGLIEERVLPAGGEKTRVFALDLLLAVSGDLREGPVHQNDPVFAVGNQDAVAGHVEDLGRDFTIFFMDQGVGHVVLNAKVVCDGAIRIRDGEEAEFIDEGSSVFAIIPEHGPDRFSGFDGLPDLGARFLLPVCSLQKSTVLSDRLGPGIACQPDELVIGEDDRKIRLKGIADAQRDRRAFKCFLENPESGLGTGERLDQKSIFQRDSVLDKQCGEKGHVPLQGDRIVGHHNLHEAEGLADFEPEDGKTKKDGSLLRKGRAHNRPVCPVQPGEMAGRFRILFPSGLLKTFGGQSVLIKESIGAPESTGQGKSGPAKFPHDFERVVLFVGRKAGFKEQCQFMAGILESGFGLFPFLFVVEIVQGETDVERHFPDQTLFRRSKVGFFRGVKAQDTNALSAPGDGDPDARLKSVASCRRNPGSGAGIVKKIVDDLHLSAVESAGGRSLSFGFVRVQEDPDLLEVAGSFPRPGHRKEFLPVWIGHSDPGEAKVAELRCNAANLPVEGVLVGNAQNRLVHLAQCGIETQKMTVGLCAFFSHRGRSGKGEAGRKGRGSLNSGQASNIPVLRSLGKKEVMHGPKLYQKPNSESSLSTESWEKVDSEGTPFKSKASSPEGASPAGGEGVPPSRSGENSIRMVRRRFSRSLRVSVIFRRFCPTRSWKTIASNPSRMRVSWEARRDSIAGMSC